jgi:hypothetical protein
MTSGQCAMDTGQVKTNTLRLRAKTGSSIPYRGGERPRAGAGRVHGVVAGEAAPLLEQARLAMRPFAERSKPSTRSRR